MRNGICINVFNAAARAPFIVTVYRVDADCVMVNVVKMVAEF